MSRMLVPDMKDLPYDIFELTGQKLYELFDMIVNNPLISKLIQNKKKKYKKKVIGKTRRVVDVSQRKSVYRDEIDDEVSPAKKPVPGTPPKNPEEAMKLKMLEDELARLRSEMSRFMAGNPQLVAAAYQDDDVTSTPQSSIDYDSDYQTPVSRRLSAAVPPPPPFPTANIPPPPPPPMTPKREALANREAPSTPVINAAPAPTKQPKPSLAELVREASQAGGLRKVDGERSPGGTIKRQPSQRIQSNSTAHADVIANALRQKFKSLQARESPVSSPEPENRARSVFTHEREDDEDL